jgi:hypothetical protein
LKYHVIFYSFSKIGHETTFLEYVWGKYLCAISIRVNRRNYISNNNSNDDNYEGKRPVPHDIIESTDASRKDSKGGNPKMKIFGR